MKRRVCLALLGALSLGACNSRKPVVVGSKRGTEHMLLGEIIAQHIENRLGVEVQRRLGLGDTPILHQAMLSSQIMLYPDTTGAMLSSTLKEKPANEPTVAFERARAEMKRTARFELLDPLGYDGRIVLVVRAEDAAGIQTISQAAARREGWKLGVSYEFQSSADGLPLINSYRLPQAAATRGLDADKLFPALLDGSLTMIAVPASDGHLTAPEWKVLEDDMRVFPPQQAAILVREDALVNEPELRAALAQLSGKIDLNTIRMLWSQVIVEERPLVEVASEFLMSAGLK